MTIGWGPAKLPSKYLPTWKSLKICHLIDVMCISTSLIWKQLIINDSSNEVKSKTLLQISINKDDQIQTHYTLMVHE